MSINNSGTRNEIRMNVVTRFSNETPGTGKRKLASRYTYYVETLNDEKKIYLRRPANLHNGFDFVVCVEEINFNPNGKRRRNCPTHDDIINDLRDKYNEDHEMYNQLFIVLEEIYNCTEPDYSILNTLNFATGFPCDLIAKTLKWLFIEQDIRYWNYSGRDMLWKGIKEIRP